MLFGSSHFSQTEVTARAENEQQVAVGPKTKQISQLTIL